MGMSKNPLLQLPLTSPHTAEMQKCAAPGLVPHCLLQFSPKNSCLFACVSLQPELSPSESRAHTKLLISASHVQHSVSMVSIHLSVITFVLKAVGDFVCSTTSYYWHPQDNAPA